ncbi:hypothetical protein SAMD00019534_061580 [Acytostelium subglobosum LB1]|uniref:hypothetical protein n=1 Tax=Acytostelium subglobosum LB1 TaxID=1410327 RepID=UPI00064497F3|nr:hypothetical protein SAMD00019534_061580 [Acytostelium subglobosum LB1]GAM22983.1 hypothetical protein SAMD00019534_061580 [Acytostelium subglobosum LB1]|eukprot:XP_012754210.1 hypothetical protein SAMD00019534_061580 [Acytostelium subglobosum LB1]
MTPTTSTTTTTTTTTSTTIQLNDDQDDDDNSNNTDDLDSIDLDVPNSDNKVNNNIDGHSDVVNSEEERRHIDSDDHDEEDDEDDDELIDQKADIFISSLQISTPALYDNYGFMVEPDLIQTHLIYKDKVLLHEKQRKIAWMAYIETNPGSFQTLSLNLPPMSSVNTTYRLACAPKPLKAMIRKGVPAEFRSTVWMRCSGAYLRLKRNPDEYYNILEAYRGKTSVATKQIALDIDRTFPDHQYLNTKEHLDQLTNVLTAYSWRNRSYPIWTTFID